MLDGEMNVIIERDRIAEKQTVGAAQIDPWSTRRGGWHLCRIAVCRQRERAAQEIEATAEEVLEPGAVNLWIATAIDADTFVTLEMGAVETGQLGQLAMAALGTTGGEHDTD